MRTLHLVVLLSVFASMPGVAMSSSKSEETLQGTIKSFECGDNCYLTIVTTDGDDVVALCAAPECKPWNEDAAMPARLIGRPVTVKVGVGTQQDDDGNDMGSFKAFTSVRIGR